MYVSSPLGIGPSGITSGVAHFDHAGHALPSFAIGLGPRGLAFGRDGKLYVAAQSLLTAPIVMRYDRAGNFLDCFYPSNVGDCRTSLPNGWLTILKDLAFGPDHNLYVASTEGVYRFDGNTGRPLETMFGLPAPFFSGIYGGYEFIAFSSDANDFNLYMVPSIAPSIWRVNIRTRQLVSLVTTFTHVPLASGIRLGLDSSKLYAINNTEGPAPGGGTAVRGQVDRYSLNGNLDSTFVQPGTSRRDREGVTRTGLGWAMNLMFGHDRNLYVLDWSGGNISCYDGTNGAFLHVFAEVPRDVGSSPVYMAFASP